MSDDRDGLPQKMFLAAVERIEKRLNNLAEEVRSYQGGTTEALTRMRVDIAVLKTKMALIAVASGTVAGMASAVLVHLVRGVAR